MNNILAGSLAAVVIILMPLSASAHWNYHVPAHQTRGNQGSGGTHAPQPLPPPVSAPTTTPASTGFTLGAFNATVGTVDVYFVDITDLSGLKACEPGKTQFIYLENNKTSNASIANGTEDGALNNFSSRVCSGSIVSFGHEFDLTENPWGGNPSIFLIAYRHVHDVVGSRVKWAWVANNSDTPGTPGIGSYWPGAQYVDIVGIDGFDWGGESLSQALQPNFAIVKAYATGNGKPLWITSTGTGGTQSSWITSGISWARSNGVSGLLYFSYNDGGNFTLSSAGAAALK